MLQIRFPYRIRLKTGEFRKLWFAGPTDSHTASAMRSTGIDRRRRSELGDSRRIQDANNAAQTTKRTPRNRVPSKEVTRCDSSREQPGKRTTVPGAGGERAPGNVSITPFLRSDHKVGPGQRGEHAALGPAGLLVADRIEF